MSLAPPISILNAQLHNAPLYSFHNTVSEDKYPLVEKEVDNLSRPSNEINDSQDLLKKTLFASYPDVTKKSISSSFHWSNLNDDDHSINPDSRQDDGIVLLVGLFNLLAVTVYAAQNFLADISGTGEKDKRIILWQVQKVLDELVLRVHSSHTASNLLSRALKYSVSSASGRNLNMNTWTTNLSIVFQEKDPLKLQEWLNKAKYKLLKEMASSSNGLYLGPKMDPRIYGPLHSLYKKITETQRSGRSFSTSLLQEVSGLAETANKLSLKEVQKMLKIIIDLGKIQKNKNIISLMQKKFSHVKNSLPLHKQKVKKIFRTKRDSWYKRLIKQRQNSRYPRLTSVPHTHTTQIEDLQIKRDKEDKSSVFMRRQGTVEDISVEKVIHSNWADKWFSLLTQVSPIALDLSTVYSTSRIIPTCLRILLCNSNKHWRKQGTMHASVSPLLSIITSWALEDATPHSLGDSLIAIRAGWMGKDCSGLSQDCPKEIFGMSYSSSSQAKGEKINDNNLEASSDHYTVIIPSDNDFSDIDNPQKQHISSNFSDLESSSNDYLNNAEISTLPEVQKYDTMLHKKMYNDGKSEEIEDLKSNHNYKINPDYLISPQPDRSYLNQRIHHGDYAELDRISNLSKTKILKKSHQARIADNLLSQVKVDGIYGYNDDNNIDDKYNYYNKDFNNHKIYYQYDSNTDKDVDNIVHSEAVTGMALQDRHIKKDNLNEALVSKMKKLKNQIKILDKKEDRKNKEFESTGEKNNSPGILNHPVYASYVVTRKPLFIKKIKEYKNNKPFTRYLPISKTFLKRKPLKFIKYKYGVRRGLPAGNVDGKGVFESPENKLFSHILKYKVKQNETFSNQLSENDKASNFINSDHDILDLDIYGSRNIVQNEQPKLKYTNGFGPNDAITDKFKNELLYQYIRDLKLS